MQIVQQMPRIQLALVDLDDHAIAVEKEVAWYGQVSAPVEEVAVDEVVYAFCFVVGEENEKREFIARYEFLCGTPDGIPIDIDCEENQTR